LPLCQRIGNTLDRNRLAQINRQRNRSSACSTNLGSQFIERFARASHENDDTVARGEKSDCTANSG
jgi:hypothetical protein